MPSSRSSRGASCPKLESCRKIIKPVDEIEIEDQETSVPSRAMETCHACVCVEEVGRDQVHAVISYHRSSYCTKDMSHRLKESRAPRM